MDGLKYLKKKIKNTDADSFEYFERIYHRGDLVKITYGYENNASLLGCVGVIDGKIPTSNWINIIFPKELNPEKHGLKVNSDGGWCLHTARNPESFKLYKELLVELL